MASSFGWTFDQSRDVTFEELLNIYRYQNNIPAFYILCAGYLGAIKQEKTEIEEDLSDFNEDEMVSNFKKLKEKREKRKKNNG